GNRHAAGGVVVVPAISCLRSLCGGLGVGRLNTAYVAPLVVGVVHVAGGTGRRLVLVLDPPEPALIVVADDDRLGRAGVDPAHRGDLAPGVVLVCRDLLHVGPGDVRYRDNLRHQAVLVAAVLGVGVARSMNLQFAEVAVGVTADPQAARGR